MGSTKWGSTKWATKLGRWGVEKPPTFVAHFVESPLCRVFPKERRAPEGRRGQRAVGLPGAYQGPIQPRPWTLAIWSSAVLSERKEEWNFLPQPLTTATKKCFFIGLFERFFERYTSATYPLTSMRYVRDWRRAAALPNSPKPKLLYFRRVGLLGKWPQLLAGADQFEVNRVIRKLV